MRRVSRAGPARLLPVRFSRRDIVRREAPHRAHFRHAGTVARRHAAVIIVKFLTVNSRISFSRHCEKSTILRGKIKCKEQNYNFITLRRKILKIINCNYANMERVQN